MANDEKFGICGSGAAQRTDLGSSESDPGRAVWALDDQVEGVNQNGDRVAAPQSPLCAEICALLQLHHDQLDQRLDTWMAHQEALVRRLVAHHDKSGATEERAFTPQSHSNSETSPCGGALASHISSRSSFSLRGEDSKRRADAVAACVSMEGNTTFSPLGSVWFSYLRYVVGSPRFEGFFALAILSNSILIGIEVEYVASHAGVDAPFAFHVIHSIYTLVFLLELTLRILVDGTKFFFCDEWAWRLLDVFIVMSSLVELVLDLVLLFSNADLDSIKNVSNVRIIRLLRITRLIRTLRIPKIICFVTALRTLVYSIVVTLRSLVWTMVLLMLIIYIFGIVFTQSVSDYRGLSDDHADNELTNYWGGIAVSMFTLFQAISGGVSWRECVEPLQDISLLLVCIFTIYLFFTLFAVLNVVTGIFCHSAIETSSRNPDLIVHSLMASKNAYVQKIRALFDHIDADASGNITIEELERILNDDTLKAYFQAMDLDAGDAWTLFKLIDTEKTHTISVNDFIDGCMRLKGSAKGIDIATLMSDNRWFIGKMSKFMRYCEGQFELIQSGSPTWHTPEEGHIHTNSTVHLRKSASADWHSR